MCFTHSRREVSCYPKEIREKRPHFHAHKNSRRLEATPTDTMMNPTMAQPTEVSCGRPRGMSAEDEAMFNAGRPFEDVSANESAAACGILGALACSPLS